MSNMRRVGAIVLVAASMAFAAAGCSSDAKTVGTTVRQNLTFKSGLSKANQLGVCSTYQVKQMQDLLGGGPNFRILAPGDLGKKGDPSVGETCSWTNTGGGTNTLTLTIEARKWQAAPALDAQYTKLRSERIGATDVAGLGDAAYTWQSPTATNLEVRTGLYEVTYSSSVQGKQLKLVPLAKLQSLAAAAVAKLK